ELGVDQDPMLARSWFEVAMQDEAEAQSDFERLAAERLEALQNTLMQGGSDAGAGAAQVPSFSVSK
ncbi:MAG: hypothetical protein AAFS03_09065, partial [Pseudomonadota bacterium]